MNQDLNQDLLDYLNQDVGIAVITGKIFLVSCEGGKNEAKMLTCAVVFKERFFSHDSWQG